MKNNRFVLVVCAFALAACGTEGVAPQSTDAAAATTDDASPSMDSATADMTSSDAHTSADMHVQQDAAPTCPPADYPNRTQLVNYGNGADCVTTVWKKWLDLIVDPTTSWMREPTNCSKGDEHYPCELAITVFPTTFEKTWTGVLPEWFHRPVLHVPTGGEYVLMTECDEAACTFYGSETMISGEMYHLVVSITTSEDGKGLIASTYYKNVNDGMSLDSGETWTKQFK